MQIVIEIPDGYDVTRIQNGSIASKVVLNAVKNGTPLPKGHGRLIDADEIIHLINEIEAEDREEELYHLFLKTVLTDAPTIIEADKAESEETKNG